MKKDLLFFSIPEKRSRTKHQSMNWLWCWVILCVCGITCIACSDDDSVKKNPYLQTSTRAMLKEVVEVKFNNIDGNTDITVDFGDGTVKERRRLPSPMLTTKVVIIRCTSRQASMNYRKESVSITCWH